MGNDDQPAGRVLSRRDVLAPTPIQAGCASTFDIGPQLS
jgi:hypothetical protein